MNRALGSLFLLWLTIAATLGLLLSPLLTQTIERVSEALGA